MEYRNTRKETVYQLLDAIADGDLNAAERRRLSSLVHYVTLESDRSLIGEAYQRLEDEFYSTRERPGEGS